MLGLGGTKAVVLVLMGVLTIGVGLLPLLVRKLAAKYLQRSGIQKFMSGCLCFGGGVLLATVFLHLLPEVRVYLEKATSRGFLPHTSYPMAELVVCFGFYLIYICEEVVHSCIQHNQQGVHHSHGGHSHGESYKMKNKREADNIMVDDPSLGKFLPDGERNTKLDVEAKNQPESTDPLGMMRTLVVVMALSLHSIMEGLALGLVRTPRDVWVLFGALSAHKLIIAFCMSMELLENRVSRSTFLISMGIFSLASPIGGMVGALLVSYMTQTSATGLLVPTILEGLSAGTILYVTFCEILERERMKHNIGQIRTWTFLFGFLFMAALQVIDSLVEEESPTTEYYSSTQSPNETIWL